MNWKNTSILAGVAAASAAATMITGAQIQDHSIWQSDIAQPVNDVYLKTYNNTVGDPQLKDDIRAKVNLLPNAYYSVAYYDQGDTNAGAIATVACKAETDTAISGGVSVVDPSKNTPVSSSFPGRMDWTTNTPKPNRLDGWIVQFGGNAGAASDKAPEKVKIYALCVPGLASPVIQTYLQSADN